MVYETRDRTKKTTHKTTHKTTDEKTQSLNTIKVRRHCLYGYSAIPTRLGKIKKCNDILLSPITRGYPRIFPDGHLLIMNIKENNISNKSMSPKNNLFQMQNETKIEWLSRISKYHPFLEIKISSDDSDFYPSFHLKAICVFKEYSDDTMGCVQLFNMDIPLSITFYHPEQITIRVIQ